MFTFNRTAYGIETRKQKHLRVFLKTLLIAPLMELKPVMSNEYFLYSELLIAPLMELKRG